MYLSFIVFLIHILVPPEEVVIHGQEHGRLGEDISMSCVSAISNPAARITWRSPTQGEVEGDQTIVESSLVRRQEWHLLAQQNRYIFT